MSHHWHEDVGVRWCPCDEDQEAPGAPALAGTDTTGSRFCPGCGKHTASVPTEQPNVWLSVEFASDGYTPTDTPHVCVASS